ncbi:MAG TPA: hypothetical protein PLK06_00590 [bacterium]|nr:hypothetical protein [bacterium]
MPKPTINQGNNPRGGHVLLAIYYRNGGDVETTPVELLPLGDEWQPRQTVTRNSRGQIIAWCFRDGQHHGDPVPTGSQAALDFDGISYMTLIEEADLLEGWLNFLRQRPQHPIDCDDFDN